MFSLNYSSLQIAFIFPLFAALQIAKNYTAWHRTALYYFKVQKHEDKNLMGAENLAIVVNNHFLFLLPLSFFERICWPSKHFIKWFNAKRAKISFVKWYWSMFWDLGPKGWKLIETIPAQIWCHLPIFAIYFLQFGPTLSRVNPLSKDLAADVGMQNLAVRLVSPPYWGHCQKTS